MTWTIRGITSSSGVWLTSAISFTRYTPFGPEESWRATERGEREKEKREREREGRGKRERERGGEERGERERGGRERERERERGDRYR